MKRFILTFTLIATFAFNASAQTYTLNECLKKGLENNYSLRITRNDEEIAHNNATLSNAGLLPTVDLVTGYKGDLGSSDAKIRSTGDIDSERNTFDQTLNAGIDVNWTIFDGFKASTTYKQLKEMELIGETGTRLAIEDFIAGLTSEYYNFIQQRLRLDNYYNAVQLSKERLRIVEERYNIGNFSRLDYQQAKVDFNADSAQYLKQQEAVITSRIALNEMMAIEQVYTPIITKETTIEVDSTLNFVELWNSMLQNNAELLIAGHNSNITQLDYKKMMSRNYPYIKLNLGYDYSYNHYSGGTYAHRNNWGGNAGVTIGFNIWDGNRRREKRNAKIEIENAKLQREQLELALKAALGNLWHAYENNLRLLDLEAHNVVTARENHEIAKERYMLGDLSGIEMRETQLSLLQAEERLLAVMYNTKLCEISLLLISGKIGHYLE
ncbi:MAG: TolC family protein [Bacteroidaceae bacterium]|nr:TolC family protein [Bacteroidaceae bacterium]